ncbi:NAD(P)-binding protein [Stipitochalara longipes BDJ]|nr:NAD(P)-binding protein [Stipitochalara longipes BDJ]
MALQVEGKTALVTGGGSGICLKFTKLLLSKGCNVPGSGGATAAFIKTDVTDWDKKLRTAFEFAIEKFKVLDIVCPGARVFEPPWSNFWHLTDGVDNDSTSTFKTFDININHPVRATQLSIDSFVHQKLGHGVVIIISSTAAQAAFLPAPMYVASKHAMSGFTRSLADFEPKLNICVNAVAPGRVKTPLWTQEKLNWVDESYDRWVIAKQVANVMLGLITNQKNVGGTVLEFEADKVRPVYESNDPGPREKGLTLAEIAGATTDVYNLIDAQYGK